MNEILLDGDEAAAQLRISRTKLTRLARRGEVPHVLLPDGEIRFRRDDLVVWVASYRQPPAAQPQEVAR